MSTPVEISCTFNASFALFNDKDNKSLYSWGSSEAGQLGIGALSLENTVGQFSPSKITKAFKTLSAG